MRADRFNGNLEGEQAGCAEGMRVPFAECALASVWDSAKRDETLRDERAVLERCGKDAVFMGEDNCGGKIG